MAARARTMAAIALLALVPTECLVAPRRPARAARLGASAPSGGDARYYLGIDLSTQSCTAIVVDAALDVAHRASVNFDASFPAYGTSNGMHATDDGVATSPVAMWLDGLDAVLELIPASLRQQVDGVSFSGQQHGSVYWSAAAAARLAGGAAPRDERPPADCYTKRADARPLPAGLPGGFREALAPEAFAVADAPIWADASTQDQCDALEAALGGPSAVAAATGSRAYARFTGHQMAALAARDPDAWQRTARVSLVSSFGPSLLRGAYVAVDASDSCGTNVGAVASRAWDAGAVEAFGAMAGVGGGAAFLERLGEAPVAPGHAAGAMAPWVARRFGFRSSGASLGLPPPTVYAGAGDNPCTAAGLGLSEPGDVALSLGTSDTFMAVSTDCDPREEGHVFASCTTAGEYLALLCYCNGAKQREKIKADFLGPAAAWADFDAALGRSPPGNGGVLGLELALPEITPVLPTPGRHFVDGAGGRVNLGDGAPRPEALAARAVVEGRFLSMRGRGARLGVRTAGGRVLAAGGASRSAAITQIAADVFGCDVLAADEPDAAALGAAFRAAHAAAGTDATRRAEITRGRGSHFTPLRRGRVDADSADAWTNRSLSSSSRSAAERLASKRSRTLTVKSGRRRDRRRLTRPTSRPAARARARSTSSRGPSTPTSTTTPSSRATSSSRTTSARGGSNSFFRP